MYYALSIVFAAVVAVLVYWFYFRRSTGPGESSDPLTHMKDLIRQGVVYEEDFITTYFKVVHDEGFMKYFGEHEKEAGELLNTMIQESTGHKNVLNNILENAK
ncbi:MAG: hypothetical protein RDU25_04230 [Patescibacteria group bacterium]|nr:hypothetical protein [Patescibacteria group bacterium]